ncbi:DUF2971 domain-containing protein [Phyllobacterium bourgognense]|uniref:DUF2971 family protein n=1 Tax=Phyllobacterium bourgognense TaxID=314236 RepID=A0A368Z0X8_9HYPH|nr:DUF2971 domain-containing protein [Phyllobacterium bourgognense]RCW85448.1 DUF2971 family protein [Phyllobacterium bourgognense]
MSEDFSKLQAIFVPHEYRRRNDLLNLGKKLVHYTSVANAISIFRKNEVWMRNARCMNDFMEVQHGFQLMQRLLEPPVDNQAEKGLRQLGIAVDEIFPDTVQETVELFSGWSQPLIHNTYVTCLSEHDPSEDDYGRLSMWRSYTSNQVGVGLVIKPLPLYLLAETFGAFSSPVYYVTEGDLHGIFVEIAQNIRANRTYLASKGKEELKGWLFTLLRSIAMCSKHPGFHEEKEWRIMHTRKLDEQGTLILDVECPNGIAQPVFKIPLKDHEQSGMTGISIPELLDRVIIGPTQFPLAVYDALVIELGKAGVADPEKIVTYSAIPLRT